MTLEAKLETFDRLFRSISVQADAPRRIIKLACNLLVEGHYPSALERIASATQSPHKDLARAWAWAKPAVKGLSEVFGLHLATEKATGLVSISYTRELALDDLIAFRQSNLKDAKSFSQWLKTWRDAVKAETKQTEAKTLVPALPEEFSGKSKRELAQEILALRLEREKLQREVGRLQTLLAVANKEDAEA